jgi:Protein of unknown function (DUF3179)
MAEARPQRMLTFRSGGWVLTLAIAVTVVGTVWNLAPLWRPERERPRGDGRTTASYGFDLATTLIPKDRIVASGMVADALPALVDPKVLSLTEIPGLEQIGRGKFLVSADKVIGVEFGGAARAYPLRMLVWHEIVNDTVGGVPIAVTYNPLSEGIAVFDRRVGGETLTFSVSGLLYQSNLLMYDRRPGRHGESLWSQLMAQAVAGPAAARKDALTLLPFALSRWDDWSAAYPRGSVLAPVPGEGARYNDDVYGSYFNSNALRFPVDPLPPQGTLPPKTRVFVSGGPGRRTVTPLRLDDDGQRVEAVGPSGTTPQVGIMAFWFAWYATHPDDPGRITR